jgi:hypothetical protein
VTLRRAEEKLKGLRTAEGTPLPENTHTELCRHLARLRVVREQARGRSCCGERLARDGSADCASSWDWH